MKTSIKIALLICWIIVIFVLTGYPALQTSHLDKYWIDKVYHFVLFLILGGLEFRIMKTLYFFTLGVSVILIAEFQQILIPGRTFELLDIIAGLVGLCFAYFIFTGYRKIKHEVPET
ncbi:MAG: VanZ family protein [candidate division WOR-3 bacterium]|nr:MAG: VanZ family protein [candidate division WOR-3 bacterium]